MESGFSLRLLKNYRNKQFKGVSSKYYGNWSLMVANSQINNFKTVISLVGRLNVPSASNKLWDINSSGSLQLQSV